MKADIASREDIEHLILSFYEKVRADGRIGPIFNQVIGDNWEHHNPILFGFWETVLFGETGYKGNPVLTHIKLNKEHPLSEEHFDRWLELFHGTVDELYEGEIANKAKEKAVMMAQLMLYKIDQSKKPGFIA